MPLPEHEAHRFAVSLDDYEDLSVADIGGTDESGYWLVVDDERLDIRYELGSHADYWEFLSTHVRCLRPANSAAVPPAVDPSAATLAAESDGALVRAAHAASSTAEINA